MIGGLNCFGDMWLYMSCGIGYWGLLNCFGVLFEIMLIWLMCG